MAKESMGFIQLHRALQHNPLWIAEPFTKGQAFVDLIMSANHKDNTFLLGNTMVTTKRGQFFTSELKLAARWKWSRKKVRSYLALMKNLEMATAEGTTKGTTITVVNYEDYQTKGTAKSTTKGTSKEHQKNNEGYTNNNDTRITNNDKEIKCGVFETFCGENKELLIAFKDWEEMRKKIKKAPTERAKQLAIKDLEKISTNVETQINVIENATLRCWQSFYPLKEEPKQAKTKVGVIPEGVEDDGNGIYDYNKLFE